jgi:hypothetical protein
MNLSNLANVQTDWIDPPSCTAHEGVGFELGWDYARHRVAPPQPYDQATSALHQGLLAGQATFGTRTLSATPFVRRWLQLRLHAWLRGRSVELVQVTPNYLRQIDVGHCPITRQPLAGQTCAGAASSIDRVRNDAGYAAGNLAVMSAQANHAKGSHRFADVVRIVQQLEERGLPGSQGLSSAEWARVAVLTSFVEPLPHAQACTLPLVVLPPNRLRLFNPVQALQAFVGLQWLKPGWSQRISRFEDLLPGQALKHDFKQFCIALLPRLIEAGLYGQPQHARWAVEDAWRSPLVRARWTRFAQALTPGQCEALLSRATARKLGTQLMLAHAAGPSTDGWQLASRGYLPYGVASGPQRGMAAASAC